MKAKNHQKEQKYYGIHACLTLWEKRAKDVIKVYIHDSNLKTFTQVLKWCAQNKKAYHVVSNQDLEKISSSVHHEGICIVAKELEPLTFDAFLKEPLPEKVCLLYFDGVQNPHNIGSILRTSAHFGIPYILVSEKTPLSPSACRIAKGGAEIVRLVFVDNVQRTLKELKKRNFSFVGTSSHQGDNLYQTNLPSRMIFAFGAEDVGMSKELLKNATFNIQIPGTGSVESLNVSVATSLCMGEFARQHLFN